MKPFIIAKNHVEILIEAEVKVTVTNEKEIARLSFDKPVRVLELLQSERVKIAYALLGRARLCLNPKCRRLFFAKRERDQYCCRECFLQSGAWWRGRPIIEEQDSGGFVVKFHEATAKKPKKRDNRVLVKELTKPILTRVSKPKGVPIGQTPCGLCPKLEQIGDHYSCPRNRKLGRLLPRGFAVNCPERDSINRS